MIKYVKWMNHDECHHGFQYKNGSNVVETFSPKGTSGGLFCTTIEHAFMYMYKALEEKLENQGWLRVVEPRGSTFKSATHLKCQKLVLGEKMSVVDGIKYLIKNGADIHYEHDTALRVACEYGARNVVELLLNGLNGSELGYQHSPDTSVYEQAPMSLCLGNNHIKLYDLVSCWSTHPSYKCLYNGLYLASYKGHAEAVEYILTRIYNSYDIEHKIKDAYQVALREGHTHVLKVFEKECPSMRI
uniref:Uncharacterized protein n=1 Tax=viral metagenome TaxID=1070528 RepID=A0A6C0CMH9_9ZZZZ